MEQVRDHRASWAYFESTLQEVASERASTLGRAAERLSAAVARYRTLVEDGADEQRLEPALQDARDAAWAMVVQRECAGFRSRDLNWLKEHWQVPDEVLRRI